MIGSGIAGPVFISIGDEDKLSAFLEKNPYVDRDQIFVDGYDFDAYNSMGFGKFTDVDQDKAKAAMKNMSAPELEGGILGWFNYLTSAAKISPIPPEGINFGEIPEGVLRLGGTFVVAGDDIVYRWNDTVPGDHPDINNVFNIAQEAAENKKKSNNLFSLPAFPSWN